jgi:FtsZ-binding cell division protein ZapB
VGQGYARIYFPEFRRCADPFAVPRLACAQTSQADRAAQELAAWSVDPNRGDARAPDFNQVREAIVATRVERAVAQTRLAAATAQEERDRYECAVRESTQRAALLDQGLREARERIEQLQSENTALKRERDQARDEFRALRHRLEVSGRSSCDAAAVELPLAGPPAPMEYPDTWDDLEVFVEMYCGPSVVLTTKAARAARASHFADIPFVYRALHFMAEYYVPVRKRGPQDEHVWVRLQEQLAQMGAEISGCGSAPLHRLYAKEYQVKHEGQRYTLDMHLRRRASIDSRLNFRLYFAWDEINERVIVGSLPDHLTNRLT